ncbi:MAG: ELM1/GtrOC1 family putative glycosyltransferase [Candidatus Omnitrophica bacterium]|nr:ELM1/GtrOC1 family putative glycosyltransferase [Candidatus Omnitrophota bacterium]MDD5771472.1 ELM1/GtrOC1 family putative glycosyltransferase [Candidatus Omnitrophota bacterium]
MKQNSIADYLSCILFRAAGIITRLLPLRISLFLGRRLGDLIYLFDARHRAVACANINKAIHPDGGFLRSARITRRAYQAFGQNLIEISFIPRINKKYMDNYIHIENRHFIDEAFKRGKGVIFLAAHEGNWELSNIICANLGFPFTLFVRDQGMPRLNNLLNSYRLKQGARIIHKRGGLRDLIDVLKDNQAIGMTVDQGGKNGLLVQFFGKPASMSTGAVKLALKYDCSIIPVFYTRTDGPHTTVILDSVYTVTRSGKPQDDLRDNLQRLTLVYEKYIRQYPHEYLWTYKIWKYGNRRDVLLLSDGKAGHLHQAESLARLACRQLSAKGLNYSLSVCEIKFRSRPRMLMFKWMFALCPGFRHCLRYLRCALTAGSLQGLSGIKPDIIISAGSRLKELNYVLAKANQARSVIIMRPGPLAFKKPDLAVIPRHDRVREGGNIVITEGALNLIDEDFLKDSSQRLRQSGFLKGELSKACIGVLIGGSSRKFFIGAGTIKELAAQLKKAAESLQADILITTSRRTPVEAEEALIKEFGDYPRCKLLVIANRKNHPDAVGGILGLSSLIISSPESISMISEAVMSRRYVAVFKSGGLSAKHGRFLNNFRDKGYIYIKEIRELSGFAKEILDRRPRVNFPEDNLKVAAALERVL